MLTSEILNKAADVIERNGWVSGMWYDADGSGRGPEECKVCAGAALNIALDSTPDYEPDGDFMDEDAEKAFSALAARVDHEIRLDMETGGDLYAGNLIGAITAWNDAAGRTADEVVAELRAAAASEREAGR